MLETTPRPRLRPPVQQVSVDGAMVPLRDGSWPVTVAAALIAFALLALAWIAREEGSAAIALLALQVSLVAL